MGARNTRSTLSLSGLNDEQQAIVTALLAALTGETPAVEKTSTRKSSTKSAQKSTQKSPEGFKRMAKADFANLKRGGLVPFGLTQKEAFEQGYIGTNADATPKVRTQKVTPEKAQKKQAKARKTKTTAKTTAKSGATWGRSLMAMVRTSGYYVGTHGKRGTHWESLTKVVTDQWKGLVAPLHVEGLAPKDAFEEIQARLFAEGHEIEHYSNSAGARRVRNASRKAFAERIAG